MKVIAIILSAYLLVLTVIPCCGFDNCQDDMSPTELSSNHETGDEDDCGSCSPFFNCESCATATLHATSNYFTTFVPEKKHEFGDSSPSLIPDAHYDFWQPPRLV